MTFVDGGAQGFQRAVLEDPDIQDRQIHTGGNVVGIEVLAKTQVENRLVFFRKRPKGGLDGGRCGRIGSFERPVRRLSGFFERNCPAELPVVINQ